MIVTFADELPAGPHALGLIFPGGESFEERFTAIGPDLAPLIREVAAATRFTGEAGTVTELFILHEGKARRILLGGLGEDPADAAAFERVGAALAAHVLTSGETRLVIDVSHGGGANAEAATRVAFGAVLRAWRHDRYHTTLPQSSRRSLAELVIVGGGSDAAEAWLPVCEIATGVLFTRTLVAEPANVVYPESFVARCEEMRGLGVELEILDEAAMTAAGMGALLGVSQGSTRQARLLAMRWAGADGPPTVFVGKGVTFDTGGISLKPFEAMEGMKWDMGGAGAVAGAMRALAGRNAKAHVIGICGLVENMPDGNAQRPGDVVTTMSGQTVEVVNTDAEGRLVLCDALTWAQRRYKPETIVDVATLTGAMIVALGHEYAGLFANDDTLANQLQAAGETAGERLWRMPLGEAYDKLINSPIADIKNIGPKHAGGITAAQFLKRFIDKGVRWAHLDIAGMAWADEPGTLWDKGATGFGVRLLDRYVADNCEDR